MGAADAAGRGEWTDPDPSPMAQRVWVQMSRGVQNETVGRKTGESSRFRCEQKGPEGSGGTGHARDWYGPPQILAQ